MYLKKHKEGKFGVEVSGYLANLQVKKTSKICFVSGDYDCLTIGEIIKTAGYDPRSILNRRLLIAIDDEIQPADAADGEGSGDSKQKKLISVAPRSSKICMYRL